MRRLDRSEAFRGMLLLAILVYCGQHLVSVYQDIQYGFGDDAYYLFSFARESVGSDWLLAVLCCLPFAMKFCEDWQSRFFYPQVLRASPRRYVASKLWYAWITGGLVAAGGTLLLFIVCVLLNPVVPLRFGHGFGLSDSAYQVLRRSRTLWMYLGELSFAQFMNGGLWALSGLAFSAYLPYRSLMLCFPIFLSRVLYSLNSACISLGIPYWLYLKRLGVNGVYEFSPPLSMLTVFIVFGLLSVLCCLAFHSGVKRRMENG